MVQVNGRWARKATWLLGGALLSLTGCMAVQTTAPGVVGVNRTQRMSPLVSGADLEKGAVQAYSQVLGEQQRKGLLNRDMAMVERVRGIARRIVPQVRVFRPQALDWEWDVNVIQSDELNAWCMPGGKIAFYSGIITRLQLTDDEIAAIMGHEIAHALREHARERMSEQATAQALIGVGAAVAGVGKAGSDLTNLAYRTTFGLRHSRLHESEADQLGVELAARAGYDPRAALSLWRKMQAASGGSGGLEFLSTHPSPATRLRDLEGDAAKVMPLYLQRR